LCSIGVLACCHGCVAGPSGTAGDATPSQWSATAAGGDAHIALDGVERDIVRHLNLARSNPPAYALTFLAPRRALFSGTLYSNPLDPGRRALRTQEGVAAVDEAIEALSAAAPMAVLGPSPALTRAASEHAREQSARGTIGHRGADGSYVGQRANLHGRWQRLVGEVIAYGPRTGMEVVARLLIDDGVPSRGHRRNILDPRFRAVGVAIAPHPGYGHVVVIDFADAVVEVVD
jgi:uncharacterized protein YkwD